LSQLPNQKGQSNVTPQNNAQTLAAQSDLARWTNPQSQEIARQMLLKGTATSLGLSLPLANLLSDPKTKEFSKNIDPWMRKQVDAGYDLKDQSDNLIRKSVKGIPVIEQLTEAGLGLSNFQTQVAGAGIKFAGSFVGGLASAATDPMGVVKGLYTMAEHIPPSVLSTAISPVVGIGSSLLGSNNPLTVNPFKAARGYFNVATGRESSEGMNKRVFNPNTSGQEDGQFWGQVGTQIAKPMTDSWNKGRYVDAVTQGALEVGSLIFGPGEIKAALKGGRTAAEVADASRIARAAYHEARRATFVYTTEGRTVKQLTQDIKPALRTGETEAQMQQRVQKAQAELDKRTSLPEGNIVKPGERAKNRQQSKAQSGVDRTTPDSLLRGALGRQGLKKGDPYPHGLKENWTVHKHGYTYEVRIHPADSKYGKTGDIYRVSRRKDGVNASGQGYGWEYADSHGNWHHTSTLKPGKGASINPNFDPQAASDTHIPMPTGNIK
jgi:hypothetical protein